MTLWLLYIIILVLERNKLSIVDFDLLLATEIMIYSNATCQKTLYVHADIQQKQSISNYIVPFIIVLEIKPLINWMRTKAISIYFCLETTSCIQELFLFLIFAIVHDFCAKPTACKSVKVCQSLFMIQAKKYTF